MAEQKNIRLKLKRALEEVCSELVFVIFFSLFPITYFAYFAFGFGVLFLILPFWVIFYYCVKKYWIKRKIFDKSQKNRG